MTLEKAIETLIEEANIPIEYQVKILNLIVEAERAREIEREFEYDLWYCEQWIISP